MPGDYSVAISDFGEAEFAVTSQSASLAVGESRVLSFDGTYIRTSSISVGVSVEGEGLAGVMVSLTGHGEVASAVTGPAGHHTFNELRKGTYFLEISGFDTAEVAFSATTRTVSVAADETENVAFDGQYLRTASIIGAVTVENKALPRRQREPERRVGRCERDGHDGCKRTLRVHRPQDGRLYGRGLWVRQ